MTRAAWGLGLLPLLGACAARPLASPPSCPPAGRVERVWIESTTPDSVSVATAQFGTATLEIRGCGFDAADNRVRFGPDIQRGVPASDNGTRLRITIPVVLRGGDEVPPMPLPVGDYDVIVESSRGRSNAHRVRVY